MRVHTSPRHASGFGTIGRSRRWRGGGTIPGLVALWAGLLPIAAAAHSFEPCLLVIEERTPHEVQVHWRPPSSLAGFNLSSLALTPTFPADCRASLRSSVSDDSDSSSEPSTHWSLRCGAGLAGTTFGIDGLDATHVDVVLRLRRLDGSTDTAVLRSGASTYTVPAAAEMSPGLSAWRFLHLGSQHILEGLDHLAFVLCLFLLTPTLHPLVRTVTAFTVGHSLTLGLATVGWLRLPSAPCEALIAASIAFVARELVVGPSEHTTLTRRHPWIVACGFGLLHGLGFASALREIGLPQEHLFLALLGFNLGVELGQLAFLVLLALLAKALPRLSFLPPSHRFLPYALGTLACAWFFDRVTRF